MNFKLLWIVDWLCLGGLMAAAPLETGSSIQNASFDKAEERKWVIRTQEATAHYLEEEGQKALSLTPNPMVEEKYKAQVSQVLPWDASMKLMPQVMIKGPSLVKAKLSIQCYNGVFSEAELLPLQEIQAADQWQVLGVTEMVEVPEYTKFIEIRIDLESGVEGKVWLANAQLGDSLALGEDRSKGKPASFSQQVGLLKERLQKEQPKLLILGDVSALGYHRFLDGMMETSGESVMAFGFVGDAPVKKILEHLKDEKVKIPEGSLVALSFGYQALLNEKQPVHELLAALKEFAALLENQGATVRVIGLFQQHEQVPSQWIQLSESFHQTLLEDGTLTLIQHVTVPKEGSTEQLIGRNHLPNHNARESMSKLLLKALEQLKNPS